MLQTLADINHRQLASDNDRANLVKSAPVALRRMARDIKALTSTRAAGHRRIEQTIPASLEARDPLRHAIGIVEFLLGRVEFVRRELLFQMRYGGAAPEPSKRPAPSCAPTRSPRPGSKARA